MIVYKKLKVFCPFFWIIRLSVTITMTNIENYDKNTKKVKTYERSADRERDIDSVLRWLAGPEVPRCRG